MLHMVRHIRPNVVYLFMTKEIENRDERDNRFEKAIHDVDPSITVKKIKTSIIDPHLHQASSAILKKHFNDICETHIEEDIYINISSGTPQLITVLNLLIVSSPYNVFPYQVTTPVNSGNQTQTTGDDYAIDDEIECNLDGDKNAETKNRLQHADLMQYKKTLVFSQIKELIKRQYDYAGALTLLKNSRINAPDTIFNLLKHGSYRLSLNTKEASKRLKQIGLLSDFPIHTNSRWAEMIEYFLIIKVQQKTGQFSNMALMLDPFSIRLQETYMKTVLNYDPNKLFLETRGQGKRKRSIISREKINQFDKKLMERLDEQYNGFYDKEPSVNIYHSILEFLHETKAHNNDGFLEISSKYLLGLKDLRNTLAHDLRTTDDDEINDTIGIHSKLLLNKIESVINHTFSIRRNHLDIYERLNAKINTLLDKAK